MPPNLVPILISFEDFEKVFDSKCYDFSSWIDQAQPSFGATNGEDFPRRVEGQGSAKGMNQFREVIIMNVMI